MASDVAKALFDQEQGLHHEIQNLTQTATGEKRQFNADEEIRWNNLHDELDKVNGRLRQILDDEKRARETESAYNDFAGRKASGPVGGGNSAFANELRSWAAGEQKILELGAWNRPQSPLYRAELEQRAVGNSYLAGANGVPNGSFTNQTNAGIVPIDFYSQLQQYLVEVSGVMQTGPTVLNTQGGEPMQIPVVAQHTGYTSTNVPNSNLVNVSQGGTLAESDPSFAQAMLSAYKFGDLIKVSREMIDDSGVNLLAYLAQSAGRAVGNQLGSVILNGGSGITNGILPMVKSFVSGSSTTGNPGTGQVAGGPSYANLIDMEYAVIAPYRQSKSCYWLAADKTLGALRKLTDNNGRAIWEPSTVLGAPDLLLGKPLVADPFMPAVNTNASAATAANGANMSILFGDFSQYFIRFVGGVRFERSDDFLFNQDLVAFRTVLRADGTLPLAVAAPNAPQPIVGFQA